MIKNVKNSGFYQDKKEAAFLIKVIQIIQLKIKLSELDVISLFDTHCHLDFDVFDGTLDDEISSANQVGVDYFFVPSVGANNWDKVANLSKHYSNIYYGLGLHPYFIESHQDNSLDLLESQLKAADKKCVAVGECGLDFQLDSSLLTPGLIEKQHALFLGQVDMAKQYNLPLVLHARKSHDQILKVLRQKASNKGVIHAFSGSYQQAKHYVDLGFYIGVGGIITYSRAKKTRDAIAKLPLDALVLETDSPDMPMSGFQGQTNHTYRIIRVLDEICTITRQNKHQLAQLLYENSKRLFLEEFLKIK